MYHTSNSHIIILYNTISYSHKGKKAMCSLSCLCKSLLGLSQTSSSFDFILRHQFPSLEWNWASISFRRELNGPTEFPVPNLLIERRCQRFNDENCEHTRFSNFKISHKRLPKRPCISHRTHGTGIFTYIWWILRVNVGKYTIHGSYGYGSFIHILTPCSFGEMIKQLPVPRTPDEQKPENQF